jgi:hypothetical protein
MKFYIRKADLELAYERCDLGDGCPARIYLYPHVDTLPDLEECTTLTPVQMTDHPSEMNPEALR